MIEVRFLGVGAALPAPGATNCSFLVRTAGLTLLFDCGPAVLQQLNAAGLTPGEVTHLFVSHRHGDHALGYPMFLLWWSLQLLGKPARARPRPTVIAGSATWPGLRTLWEVAYPDGPVPPVDTVELPSEWPSRLVLTEKVTLSTVPMVHSDLVPVLGLRLEAEGKVLAFTGDTSVCEGVVDLARGADLLVMDSCWSATVEPARTSPSKSHCTAREAGALARRAGIRRLALVHIAAEYTGRHAALVEEARAAFPADSAVEVFAPIEGYGLVL
jgi:ribonuclease Z